MFSRVNRITNHFVNEKEKESHFLNNNDKDNNKLGI